jgi:uncharacterized iron-regulated membrane protein
MLLKLKTWYSLHKWLSIITGVAIIVWLITGLVITLPDINLVTIEYPEATRITAATVFEEISLSPAAAIAKLDEILGQPAVVNAVDITPVGDRLAYQLALEDGSMHLIDVETGQPITVDPELATAIAQEAFPAGADVAQVEYLEHHDSGYMYGAVPAYRMVLDDAAQTYVHVPAAGGEISANNRTTRLIEIFSAAHTLAIFEVLLPVGDSFVIGMIWLSSLVTLVAALIGYYMALPRRWQTRQKRRTAVRGEVMPQ